jgi:hypothetical protein
MQSMPLKTNVVSSHPAGGEMYSKQHLREQVCQWFAVVGGFPRVLSVLATIKTDLHDITEILLKVA